MASKTEREHAEFYDHKRVMHGGGYDGRCGTCRELWQTLVAASKRAAGVREYE
jgi:hypothetical protein